jgi:hypothetical protein
LKADRQRLACRSGQSGPSELNTHLAYAEACVMLMECLMLVLIEKRVLGKEELVAEVENAINTKAQILADRGHSDIVPIAMGVLTQIANSLEALP